jgi:hypothetical protein
LAVKVDVALLKDVEEAHLDFARQIRQLVDGEDAAVGARQQAVMHRQLVRELQPGACRLDRIDVADHVGDGHVGRRQLLHVAGVALEPGNRRPIAGLGHLGAARAADRLERVVVDLARRHHGNHVVEQRHQRAQEARLGLATKTEQDEMVPGQQRVDELGQHRVVVADDAGKERASGAQFLDQVVTHLFVHVAVTNLTALDGAAQIAQRGDHRGIGHTVDPIAAARPQGGQLNVALRSRVEPLLA